MGFEVIQFKDKNIFADSWLVWKHFRKFKIQTSCDSDIQNHQCQNPYKPWRYFLGLIFYFCIITMYHKIYLLDSCVRKTLLMSGEPKGRPGEKSVWEGLMWAAFPSLSKIYCLFTFNVLSQLVFTVCCHLAVGGCYCWSIPTCPEMTTVSSCFGSVNLSVQCITVGSCSTV